jgi:replicative DNA helicase
MKANNIQDMDIYGKVPPQAPELERAVLGALLIQSEAIYEVMDIIDYKSFYSPIHSTVYKSISKLSYLGKPIDILTVSMQLRKSGELDNIGGEVFLSELTDNIATSAHIVEHAMIIKQKDIQRNLIEASTKIQKKSYDESQDIDELIEFAEMELFKITDVNISREVLTTDNLITDCLNQLEQKAKSSQNTSSLIGVPSGFTEIDRMTVGWQSPDLIIVAARPAMGKSAFCLALARNARIDFDKNVAVFSLEMSAKQLTDRLIVSESEVNPDRYKRGTLLDNEWVSVESASGVLSDKPIFIDETPSLSIFELRSKCRKLKRTSDISLVIIDYLQLMTVGSGFKGNREQEISFISRSLKALAKELDIPIIALSQLNRSVESRGGDKRPQLSDLRESGAIEQDADLIVFIYRDEVYHEDTPDKGITEIIIA